MYRFNLFNWFLCRQSLSFPSCTLRQDSATEALLQLSALQPVAPVTPQTEEVHLLPKKENYNLQSIIITMAVIIIIAVCAMDFEKFRVLPSSYESPAVSPMHDFTILILWMSIRRRPWCQLPAVRSKKSSGEFSEWSARAVSSGQRPEDSNSRTVSWRGRGPPASRKSNVLLVCLFTRNVYIQTIACK